MSSTNRSGKPRRILRLVIQWTIPIAIVTAFVFTGHLGEALSALAGVSLIWAFPLVCIGVALPLSHAWRWCFLLKRTGAEISLAASTRITALASLINYAAPGFLGAPAKAILARDGHAVPLSRSLPTLAVEQILDALLLALGGTIAVLIAGPAIIDAGVALLNVEQSARVIIVALAAAALLIALLFGVRRFLPGFAGALRTATSALLHSRVHLRPIGALTLTRWVLDMLAVGVASIAVGLRLSLIEVLLLANLSLLVGLVAPVPGGLGVREGMMAAIAGVIGASIPAVLALSVLHRAGLAIGLPIVLGAAKLREWSAG